jgi:hypothetical protein
MVDSVTPTGYTKKKRKELLWHKKENLTLDGRATMPALTIKGPDVKECTLSMALAARGVVRRQLNATISTLIRVIISEKMLCFYVALAT